MSSIAQWFCIHFVEICVCLFCSVSIRYSPADIAFLGEYVTTMSPVAKSLNILQGEINIQMGWLLLTITTLTTKLEKSRPSLRFCKPLVDALLKGLRKRFESMMSEPELIAVLVPRFKTSWTSNDTVLQLGKEPSCFFFCLFVCLFFFQKPLHPTMILCSCLLTE